MAYRIWDETVLLEKADFSLELDISERYDVPNPDGTAPVARLKVTGTNIRYVLFILSKLAEDDAVALAEAAYTQCADDLGIELDDDADELTEEVADRLYAALEELHVPFISLTITASGITVEDADGTAEVTITAPSYLIAINAYLAMTTKQRLSSLATSFMPLDDDDDDY